MKTAADCRIEAFKTVTLNGKRMKAFNAFVRQADEFGRDAFVFAGAHTAPAKTADEDLWAHCESGSEDLE